MRRDVTRDIWRAVVVAGAMIGTSACSSSPKPDTAEPVVQQPVAQAEPVTPAEPAEPAQAKKPPPPVDAGVPDAAVKRPRGNGQKPKGRGFILA